jgi:hypothetical protein
MPYGTVSADIIQSSVTGVSLGAGNATNFKNRFINGNMIIDQRNAGASVTPTTINTQNTLDRWTARLTQASKFSVQQSTTVPAGFLNSMAMTSLSSYTLLSTDFFGFGQRIEGFNVVDLGWGTANAQTITLSFWVRSSLTGTFGGSIYSYSLGYPCYPFSYTIFTANTWQQISITVPGPTSGQFYTAGTDGYLVVDWSLGAGSATLGTANTWNYSTLYRGVTGQQNIVSTNGATFYVTGAQFEVGSAATGFEFRDYGRELILCQRYYLKTYSIETVPGTAATYNGALAFYNISTTISFQPFVTWQFPVQMRTTPTITFYSAADGSTGNLYRGSNFAALTNTAVNGSRQVSVYPNGQLTTTGDGYFQMTVTAEL